MFNANFFQPNKSYTVEMAAQKLIEKGFSGFSFSGSSFTNGASFYFTFDNGNKARVSDHPLTGKRIDDYDVNILFVDVKVFLNPTSLRNRYLSGEITKSEYKSICKEKGFIFKP